MKLFLISQDEIKWYDSFDSAVVAAMNEEEARNINPDSFSPWGDKHSSWCSSPNLVTVTYIGEAEIGDPNEQLQRIIKP